MSPDARERVEGWLEGCRKARCDGYMRSEFCGEGDRGEEVNGEELGEKKVEKEIEEIGVKEEPGVSSR
jgi:hypothetical protein